MTTDKKKQAVTPDNTDGAPAASNRADYDSLIADITAIPADKIESPVLPPRKLIGWAEELHPRAVLDKEALTGAGLESSTIDLLQPAAGTLRYAQAQWSTVQKRYRETNAVWKAESPVAVELRDRLRRDFLFAFRNSPEKIEVVRDSLKGQGNDDMIQHLANLSAIGKEYPAELQKIGFDFALLDKAEEFSARLADILGELRAKKSSDTDRTAIHTVRDQAYTFLRNLINEVREYGKYVFHDDVERYAAYAGTPKRRNRKHEEETPVGEAAATIENRVA